MHRKNTIEKKYIDNYCIFIYNNKLRNNKGERYKMKPFIKWAGGKEKELSIIKENLPVKMNRYIEPFIGGGAVYLGLEKKDSYINDLSVELTNLYKCVSEQNKDFFTILQSMYDAFRSIDMIIDNNEKVILDLYNSKLSIDKFISKFKVDFDEIGKIDNKIFDKELKKNLSSKIKRSAKLESTVKKIPNEDRIKNIECAIKSAYYMLIRTLYNHPDKFNDNQHTAFFYFIREYCYSSMFRYNANGEFNVPYGGISYNRKDFQAKIDYLKSKELVELLSNTYISNNDFEAFINKIKPKKNDFIFLDPPYDSDFSTYCMNEFDKEAQIRLRDCMLKTKANFMLVIKETEFIRELYEPYFNIKEFDKTYLVSFKNRNNRDVNHLIITNY